MDNFASLDPVLVLTIKFAFFALISSFVNMLFQYASFAVYEGFLSLYLAMLLGTSAGLTSKYILDKKWIFNYTPVNNKDDAKKFFLYSSMGILTTIIFWVTEMAFYYLSPHPDAKYFGAIIGLAIGYIIKYYLDKQFVFIQ
jgi:putative flippase GtrA